MSERTGKWFLVALCLLLETTLTIAQRSASSTCDTQTTGKSTTVQMQGTNTKFADAIKNYSFKLQTGGGYKGEYKLESTIDAASTSANDNLKLDYQVGTIDGKPAFVSVIVDRSKAPKGNELTGSELRKAEATIGVNPSVTVRVDHLEKVMLQGCTDGKRCVKTDKDGNCIKWVCEK